MTMVVWALPSGGRPLYHRLHRLIRRHVVSGALRPGDRLPDERDMARLCGVSRATVRAALALLSAEGLISRRTRTGTTVRAAPNISRPSTAVEELYP